jgi:hypothetical protein
MTRNRKIIRPPRNVYERLSQRLDELAEREGCYDNTEKIRLMRQLHFRDVDELLKSGTLKIPK